MRSVLVKVPYFSGKAEAGRITSARYAVSVRKMSCTTSISSVASAWRAWSASGSLIAGFSPMMYMPLMVPASIALITSTTVRPGLSSSDSGATFQALAKRALRLRVVDALVVGVHHRDQAGVGRALHVVLAAQRVQAGARAADLAGHQRQRDQAARVVGAVHVLADAHAPQDHRALAGGVQARHLADGRPRRCRRSAPSPRGCSP